MYENDAKSISCLTSRPGGGSLQGAGINTPIVPKSIVGSVTIAASTITECNSVVQDILSTIAGPNVKDTQPQQSPSNLFQGMDILRDESGELLKNLYKLKEYIMAN